MFTDEGGLRTVRPYGAERRPLPSEIAEEVVSARVSHDGQKIVYSHDGGLSTARIDGSDTRPLTNNPEDDDQAWSPDDNWVAYDRGWSDIRLNRIGGRVSVQLTQMGTACCAHWSVRSP